MNYRSLMIFLLMYTLTACTAVPDKGGSSENTQEGSSQIECPEVMPTPKSKPVFLERIFPVGSIGKAQYDNLIALPSPDFGKTGGIEVIVKITRLNSKVVQGFARSVSLMVDEWYANSPVRIEDGLMPHGPEYYYWAVNLDLGFHKATLITYLDTGERVEYSWNICITP